LKICLGGPPSPPVCINVQINQNKVNLNKKLNYFRNHKKSLKEAAGVINANQPKTETETVSTNPEQSEPHPESHADPHPDPHPESHPEQRLDQPDHSDQHSEHGSGEQFEFSEVLILQVFFWN
jgi:hypothetical protein